MQPWKHLKEPEVTKVGWRHVTSKVFERPDGQPAEYTVYGKPGARHGAVIALTEDGQVVVAKQFRPGPEVVMFELPGGGAESGEDLQDAVMRELREETGYVSEEVELLGEVSKDAYMEGSWVYYLAKNSRRVTDQELDDGEFVEVHLITIDELISNAKEGRMSDPVAVLMAYETLKSTPIDES